MKLSSINTALKKIKRVTALPTIFRATLAVCSMGAIAADESELKGDVFSAGKQVYEKSCSVCHDNPQNHTPPKSTLGTQPPQQIFDTLTGGVMRAQGVLLSSQQKNDVAEYLTGRKIGEERTSHWNENTCDKKIALHMSKNTTWNGWGLNVKNTRHQTQPGFSKTDLHDLKVKWAFSYPGGRRNSQPSIVGNYIFTGLFPGKVFALDAETGCTVWSIDVDSGVRNSITVIKVDRRIEKVIGKKYPKTKYIALFGTSDSYVFGVDAETGEVLWKNKIDENLVGRITGSGIYHDGLFYVPMSSNEEVAATGADYQCCTFRGSVSAIDVATGESAWKTFVIDKEPTKTKINKDGNQMFGPAGGAIWSSPTIDVQRGLLYVATGDSYTDVVEDGSDAIVAMELKTGNIRWKNQVTSRDNFVLGCGRGRSHGNCPEELGPDYDFGSSPILFELPNKKTVLLAGQKSSDFYMMDPDTGKIVWQKKLGHGGALGGIQWGFSTDKHNAYVAVSDLRRDKEKGAKPGLHAINVAKRKVEWYVPAPVDTCEEKKGFFCNDAYSQAVTTIPGVAFVGGMDGHFRAYATDDGSMIWDYNASDQVYQTVNSVEVKGSYFDGGGAVISNGMLVVNSGFNVREGEEGNVLLVFTKNGK
ncbi:MAG: PQQ-binding-like beta-propeller repeat protein [Cellvibrionaceae bacterium]